MLLTLEVTYRLEIKINQILEGAEESLAKTMAMIEVVRWNIVIHEAKAKYELTSPALCSESASRD